MQGRQTCSANVSICREIERDETGNLTEQRATSKVVSMDGRAPGGDTQ